MATSLIQRLDYMQDIVKYPPIYMELDDLGRFLARLSYKHNSGNKLARLMRLNNKLMFDPDFAVGISLSENVLKGMLSGNDTTPVRLCEADDLIFAHIGDDFPNICDDYKSDYLYEFGEILLNNGFREITNDLVYLSKEYGVFDESSTRSFIYVENEFGKKVSELFDEFIKENIDKKYSTEGTVGEKNGKR